MELPAVVQLSPRAPCAQRESPLLSLQENPDFSDYGIEIGPLGLDIVIRV